MITVVGSLNLDFFIDTPRLPAPGETVLGHRFRQSPGGKGANQACAAARLGARTHLIGCVGSDPFGTSMLENLSECGVVTDGVVIRPGTHSGVAFIAVDAQGGNQIIVAPGANACLSPPDLAGRADLIRRAKVLVAQLEVPLPAVETALRLAREAGVITVLNPAPATALTDDLLRLCDWILPNEPEAAALAGQPLASVADAPVVARALRRRAPDTGILITLGAVGAWLDHRDESILVPSLSVQAVDTVGAGDAFVGAFAVQLAEGKAPRAAAQFAATAAALKVTRPGAQAGLPTRLEVERRLAAP